VEYKGKKRIQNRQGEVVRRGQRSGSTWKWLLRTLLTMSFTPSICAGNTSEGVGEGKE
jgi:hypothetical protein